MMTIKKVISIFACLISSFILFFHASEWIWPEFNGSYNLSNNIYMIEWDGGGKVIVRGTNIKGNTCYGGEQLIPTRENQYDSLGNFAEYVIDAQSDGNWIIARTDNKSTHQNKFYILNINNVNDSSYTEMKTRKKIECYIDSTEFSNECYNKGIHVRW